MYFIFFFIIFCLNYHEHPILPSFPTRRSSDLAAMLAPRAVGVVRGAELVVVVPERADRHGANLVRSDRKSTRLNSSHRCISYAVFCLKKKKKNTNRNQNICINKETEREQDNDI